MIKPMRQRQKIDYVVANVENAAGGFGITPEMSIKMFSYGIDCQTSGNHIWDRVDIIDYFATQNPKLIRPANYPIGVPGKGALVDQVGETRIAVINLMGRTYLKEIDCPFQVASRELLKVTRDCSVIVVDFHAEATSEKQAMAYYLDGKVSAVIGSHTHVQTADSQVSARGTAYITDAGMTGAHDSIIGMQKGPSLGRFLTGMPKRFTAATDDIKLSGVVLEVDSSTGRATTIEPFRLDFDLSSFKPKNILGESDDDSSDTTDY
jgi:metallophosphoesterase (TIGR00282 family)